MNKNSNMKKNKVTLLKKNNLSEIKLDLLSNEKKALNLGEEWFIEVEKPHRNFFTRTFGLRVSRDVLVTVRDIRIADDLIADDKKLFSIRIKGQKYTMDGCNSVDVHLDSLSTSFNLFLETSAITDCRKKFSTNDLKFNISFTIAVINKETSEDICALSENVSISLTPVATKPEIEIIIDHKDVQYEKSLSQESIGYLVIRNNSPLICFPTIDIDVLFNWELERSETIPLPNDSIYLDLKKCNTEFTSDSNEKFCVKNFGSTLLGNNPEIKVPIIADFSKLGNSYEFDKRVCRINVEVDYRHHSTSSSNILKKSVVFVEHGNTMVPELHIYVKDGDSIRELQDGKKLSLSQKSFLYAPSTAPVREEIGLLFKNHAESGLPHSGIIIGDFSYDSLSFSPDTTLATYSKKRLTAKDVFTFSNAHGTDDYTRLIKDYVTLESEPGSELNFIFGFSNNDIKDLHAIKNNKNDYHITINVEFSFKYWINEVGDNIRVATGLPSRLFHGIIEIPVFQSPNADWLGIDFGTSAIVSQYAGHLLDLHAMKQKIFNVPTGKNGIRIDRYEQNSPFLSSNIILRQNAIVDKNNPRTQLISQSNEELNYDSLAVCLSPTNQKEDENLRYLLPCLKLIIGYENLPDLERLNEQFRYYSLHEETGRARETRLIEEEDGDKIPTELAKVDKVFEETYKELFTYYISKCLPENISQSQINRLVLTVPNTFTPRHIDKLNSIVHNSLKELNIRDICFVSESDSVACFYQKNRAKYNKLVGRDISAIDSEETVLVYDMGAGTLDLTLFKRKVTGKTIDINVLGKIGIAKAGNYLDYVLARLVAKRSPHLQRIVDNIGTDTALMNSARALKNFIKEELKPQLDFDVHQDESEHVVVLDSSYDQNLPIREPIKIDLRKDILYQEEFKSYIHSCTNQIVSNFLNFLDFNAKIDTVIVSGRASKLRQITAGLDKALKGRKSENFATIFTGNGKLDKSKTSVVEGAMVYADWVTDENPNVTFKGINIVACYGIIYQDINGEEHYAELFNPRRNLPNGEYVVNGIRVMTYETEDVVLDLSNSDSILLIQSYAADTESEWKKEERDEYISIVASYNSRAFNSRHDAHLHIEVDRENTLRLYVNNKNTEGFSPNKIELNNSTIAKSLWPIYTY